MDVSPELLREIEFRERWRGYDPDEVDDLLERMAIALEQMQEQLRDARSRVDATASPEEVVSDDQLRRTLVLAQRTADAAVQEATEEAERIVRAARADVEGLDAERRTLQAQVEALRSWLEDAPAIVAVSTPEPPPSESDLPESDLPESDLPESDLPESDAMGEDGEPTGEHRALADDPFFAELRRAVTDTEPLGPRDEGAIGAIGAEGPYRGREAESDEAALAGSRFRLRRRR